MLVIFLTDNIVHLSKRDLTIGQKYSGIFEKHASLNYHRKINLIADYFMDVIFGKISLIVKNHKFLLIEKNLN